MPILLAHRLTKALADRRKNGDAQVAPPRRQGAGHGRVRGRRSRSRVDTVVVSTQHARRRVATRRSASAIIEDIIEPAIPKELRRKKMKYHINPTGRFVIGGPQGDAGLTGRKIIVDTYGGMGRHGGGAFSGKDPSKVDRSACYAARWVAKNIVAAKLARRCEVQVAYAIGVAEPVSVHGRYVRHVAPCPSRAIMEAVARGLRPHAARASSTALDLRKPIYSATSAYGHFGRTPEKIGNGQDGRRRPSRGSAPTAPRRSSARPRADQCTVRRRDHAAGWGRRRMIEVVVSRLGLDRATQSYVVVLQEKGGTRLLPIWIGQPEAESIVMHMHNIKRARPLTHDLVRASSSGLGAQLRRVQITRVEKQHVLRRAAPRARRHARADRRAPVRQHRDRAPARRADLRRRSRCSSSRPRTTRIGRRRRARIVRRVRMERDEPCAPRSRADAEQLKALPREPAARGLREVQSVSRVAARRRRCSSALAAIALGARVARSAATPVGAAAVARGRRRTRRRARPQQRARPLPASWSRCIASAPTAPARSTRCAPTRGGHYTFATDASASDDALYFAAAVYRGIAYFSSPLRGARVQRRRRARSPSSTRRRSPSRFTCRDITSSSARRARRRARRRRGVRALERHHRHASSARDSLTPVWTRAAPDAAPRTSPPARATSAGVVAARRGDSRRAARAVRARREAAQLQLRCSTTRAFPLDASRSTGRRACSRCCSRSRRAQVRGALAALAGQRHDAGTHLQALPRARTRRRASACASTCPSRPRRRARRRSSPPLAVVIVLGDDRCARACASSSRRAVVAQPRRARCADETSRLARRRHRRARRAARRAAIRRSTRDAYDAERAALKARLAASACRANASRA